MENGDDTVQKKQLWFPTMKKAQVLQQLHDDTTGGLWKKYGAGKPER